MAEEGTGAWYSAQADTLRALANRVTNPETQLELIRLAARFDVLARHADHREKKD